MNSLIKVSLRYGVLAGVIGSGLLLTLYAINRHPFLIPVYLDFRIILFSVFIFFALREFRDYHQNGVMYFWQGFIASFIFTVCYALIASGAVIAFIYFVPEFLAEYIRLETVQLRSLTPEVIDSIGKDVYERNLELLPSTTGVTLGVTYLVQSFLISFFISLILSVTLRRQPQT
ncbi:MAG: DUF4199 domain-containing protein [Bacteroidota bacterium]|nr:DUF4199 domain-containing protein [Bacteroidota bacterium]